MTTEREAQAIRDMKAQWMVTNPCEDCDIEQKEANEHYYDLENNCRCYLYYQHGQANYAQKKLLEYLIRHFWSKDVLVQNILKEMLKQLEENNE
jgi:hypothetical protein